MANQVMLINRMPQTDLENKQAKLHNGDLIIIRDTFSCLVSSFISEQGTNKSMHQYCSLIDLKSGAKIFSEPCSRNTTYGRIFKHLKNRYSDSVLQYFQMHEFEIVGKDNYNIAITVFNNRTTKENEQ
jgi:hypothetical protein